GCSICYRLGLPRTWRAQGRTESAERWRTRRFRRRRFRRIMGKTSSSNSAPGAQSGLLTYIQNNSQRKCHAEGDLCRLGIVERNGGIAGPSGGKGKQQAADVAESLSQPPLVNH